jgi:toxin-antitoxin system PIN domain toxin
LILTDANILVYAFRRDAELHAEYSDWLETALSEEPAFGYSELVLSSFLRIVTHPKVFAKPSGLKEALAFTEALRKLPNAIRLAPDQGHWEIFQRICAASGANGNRVPDAYLAALAIESGCTWITADRGFARDPGLKWRHPLGD